MNPLPAAWTPNTHTALNDAQRLNMLKAVEADVRQLLVDLLVDLDDPNVSGTPLRVARMLVEETLAGRYNACPVLTDFPNTTALDELYVVGPVAVRSTCAHHLAPIVGWAWVGVLPSDRIIGLSKFSRLVSWIMARLQVQESATQQIADALEVALEPKGLGVVVRAKHMCLSWRGVREPCADMTTSVMRRALRESVSLRAEFLSLIRHDGESR